MSSINMLTPVAVVTTADMVPLYSASLGGDGAASMAALAMLLQSMLQSPSGAQTMYAAPNASGFSVIVAPIVNGGNVHLLMTPVADYAAGTIVLPALPIDGQRVNVTSTHAVTALTVSGGSVNGTPTTLGANGFFTLKYDGVTASWYRIS